MRLVVLNHVEWYNIYNIELNNVAIKISDINYIHVALKPDLFIEKYALYFVKRLYQFLCAM